MKCLVTGGAGFIGSNLVRRLLKEGHDVVVIDNMTTGNSTNLDCPLPLDNLIRANIKHGLKDLEYYFWKPEVIFHLGIPSSSPIYKADKSLVGTTINEWLILLELAKGIASSPRERPKIVWASSSSVYNGNPTIPPWNETLPIHAMDYYTECRYAMERLGQMYFTHHGVRNVGLRFFSVYGPHEEFKKQYANMLTQFLWSLMRGERPVIFGDGEQYRDFVYVDDVVETMMKVAFTPYPNDVNSGVFNVGTGNAYSFNRILAILNLGLGTNIEPKYVPNPIKNYVRGTRASTIRLNSRVHYVPDTNLIDGIRKTMDYYQSTGLRLD